MPLRVLPNAISPTAYTADKLRSLEHMRSAIELACYYGASENEIYDKVVAQLLVEQRQGRARAWR